MVFKANFFKELRFPATKDAISFPEPAILGKEREALG